LNRSSDAASGSTASKRGRSAVPFSGSICRLYLLEQQYPDAVGKDASPGELDADDDREDCTMLQATLRNATINVCVTCTAVMCVAFWVATWAAVVLYLIVPVL
jgi:hypothetical protein